MKMKLIVREHGLSMSDLGSVFKKAPSTINNYLLGKTDMPLPFFIEFCDYFKLPYLYVLEHTQESQRLKIEYDNSVKENKLISEISELKTRIIELQEGIISRKTVFSKAI